MGCMNLDSRANPPLAPERPIELRVRASRALRRTPGAADPNLLPLLWLSLACATLVVLYLSGVLRPAA